MGLPQQQGSKTAFAFPVPVGTKLPARSKVVMKDANEKNLKPWRDHAKTVLSGEWGATPLLTGPVHVRVTFAFPRPAYHFGSGRNADVLKASAPTYKISAPDLDKLQRAVGDALTGTVIKDDALVAVWETRKIYAPEPYVDITVIDLSGGSFNDKPGSAATPAGTHPVGTDSPGAD